MVEFGVHVNKVVAEKGRERGIMGLDDVCMDNTTEEGTMR